MIVYKLNYSPPIFRSMSACKIEKDCRRNNFLKKNNMENSTRRCSKCGDVLKCLICDNKKNLGVYGLYKINSKVFCIVVGATILLFLIDLNWPYSIHSSIFIGGLILGEIIGGIAIIYNKNR